MNNSQRKLMQQFVVEEQKAKVDGELLAKLRGFAAQDTMYFNLTPERRNTLNAFFKEITGFYLEEVAAGEYGPSIVLDSTIILAFECGLRLGQEEKPGEFGRIRL